MKTSTKKKAKANAEEAHEFLGYLNLAVAPSKGLAALEAEVAARRRRRAEALGTAEEEAEMAAAVSAKPVGTCAGTLAAQMLEALRTRVVAMPDAEWRRRRFLESIAPRMRAQGVPARYCVDVAEWQCVPQEKVFDYCEQRFTQVGSIVALVGERGVGKTFIAAQLVRQRVEGWMAHHERRDGEHGECVPGEEATVSRARGSGRYAKLVDLISRFKPLYADFGSIETDRLMQERERLCRESLLCLDELHECEDQRLKSRVLTDILDRRYSNCVDTLLISNEVAEDFRVSIGDSALSRITEHGLILTCQWKSWRG